MNKFTRDEITTVLMALDAKVRDFQSAITEDVLDGEYKKAARVACDLTAILNGMAEFDSLAPQYPEVPEDNMPVMAALYIKGPFHDRQMIPGIKIIREPFGLNLKEAKALLDAVNDGYCVFIGYVGLETGNKLAQELFDKGWDAWCVTNAAEGDILGFSKAISLEDIKAKRVPSLLY